MYLRPLSISAVTIHRVALSFAEPRVVCRPALPSDTADVLEFTKAIWEGHDYIQYVWPDWLADPHGLLIIAQYGPHAVGMAKVSLISPGQWWMEGLRVDPKFQGLKIGSHLHEYMDAWWTDHGNGTIRLLTSSERVQVHHLCQRTGYSKVGEVFGYRFPPGEPATAPIEGHNPGILPQTDVARGSDVRTSTADVEHAFRPAPLVDVSVATAFASSHPSYPNGLMDSGWRFSTPDDAILGKRLELGRLHWWRDRRGLLATWQDDEEDGRVLAIGLAAVAEPSLLPDLLRDVGRLAAQESFTYVHWLAPMDAAVQAALQQAGYVSDWEQSGYIFEKHHRP